MLKAIISPSLLASDFSVLKEECQRMEKLKADWLHLDVMDGHFVPNITFGPPIVNTIRKSTNLFLDLHLMVSNPEKWVVPFAQAGGNCYTFHIEATTDPDNLISIIRQSKMQVGIAINPSTCIDRILPYCPKVDMILVMTVQPGFGGQKFNNETVPKIKFLRKTYPTLNIQVDGGLNEKTIEIVAKAGANVIVSGSGIFKSDNPGRTIQNMRMITNNYIQ